MIKSVRVVNDTGGPFHTKIYNAETGAEIHGATNISFSHGVDSDPRVTIDLLGVSSSFVAPPSFRVMHPETGDLREVSSITFADGTSWPRVVDVTTLGKSTREYTKA